MLKLKVQQFLSLNVNPKDHRTYRRIVLTHFLLIAIMFSTLFFFFLNLYLKEYFTATIDMFGFSIALYALYQLRVKHQLEQTTRITTGAFILFFLIFVYIKGNEHFGLIWSIYAPILAFSLNGKRIGLYFSLIFYTIAFILAFTHIGVWNNGSWDHKDFLRFFFASNILVYLLYLHEQSLEKSDFKLKEVRAKEQEYINKLQEISITDPLTTLYNRRYFNEVMPKVISIAKRNGLYITFFILDVDYFKPYNDNYGHIAGDKALVKISKTIKQHVQRDDDFVFRFGGEEFGGVLLSSDIKSSEAHVQEIIKIIQDLGIEHKYSQVSDILTASIGIVTVDPHIVDTIETLYILADKELYRAKEKGRNRCYCKRVLEETA